MLIPQGQRVRLDAATVTLRHLLFVGVFFFSYIFLGDFSKQRPSASLYSCTKINEIISNRIQQPPGSEQEQREFSSATLGSEHPKRKPDLPLSSAIFCDALKCTRQRPPQRREGESSWLAYATRKANGRRLTAPGSFSTVTLNGGELPAQLPEGP